MTTILRHHCHRQVSTGRCWASPPGINQGTYRKRTKAPATLMRRLVRPQMDSRSTFSCCHTSAMVVSPWAGEAILTGKPRWPGGRYRVGTPGLGRQVKRTARSLSPSYSEISNSVRVQGQTGSESGRVGDWQSRLVHSNYARSIAHAYGSVALQGNSGMPGPAVDDDDANSGLRIGELLEHATTHRRGAVAVDEKW